MKEALSIALVVGMILSTVCVSSGLIGASAIGVEKEKIKPIGATASGLANDMVQSYTIHAPLRINNNAGFAAYANGGGDGSVSSPWVIEGLDINGTGVGYCVYIGNTTEYFIVRDCYLHNANGLWNYSYYTGSGITFRNVTNGKILDSTTTLNNNNGILFFSSSNNSIVNSYATSNNQFGIYLQTDCYYNTITNNIATNNQYGIILTYSSDNNVIDHNRVTSNSGNGIFLGGDSVIAGPSNNVISNNTVSYNGYGFVIQFSSTNNIITGNTVAGNTGRGIHIITSSNNNRIYHNNLINNAIQAYDFCINYWDSGYPSGGNYWSDYIGSDILMGSGQDVPGSDDIGDTPYTSILGGMGAKDNYPFISSNTWLSMNGWHYYDNDIQSNCYYPFPSDTPTSLSSFELLWDIPLSGSARTGDIDNDGDIEIVIIDTTNKKLIAYSEGTELWSADLGADAGIVPTWMDFTSRNCELADYDMDGTLEIGIAVSEGGTSSNGKAMMLFYDGEGNLIKSIPVRDCWTVETMKCVDLDNDGDMEVLAGLLAGYTLTPRGIYAFDYNTGIEIWHYDVAPFIRIGAVADINQDGFKELLLEASSPSNGYSVNGTSDSNTYIIALNSNGSKLWARLIGNDHSKVCVADLENDGNLDIIATQNHWGSYPGQAYVYILNPDDGTNLKMHPGPINQGYGCPAICDINDDDVKEIMILSNDGYLSVFDSNLSLINSIAANYGYLAANDINGDGNIEIIVTSDASNQATIYNGELTKLWNYTTRGKIIISDLTGDGINEIITAEVSRIAIIGYKEIIKISPSPPINLLTTPYYSFISLSWNPPASNGGAPITAYNIYRGTASNAESFLASVSILSYYDYSLSVGQTYFYKITAVNSIGEGAFSNEANASFRMSTPEVPQNVIASSGSKYVNLSWNAPTFDGGYPVTNYKIYRGTYTGGESHFVTVGDIRYCNDTPLTNGQQYFYRVSAVNSKGEGPRSDEVHSIPNGILSATVLVAPTSVKSGQSSVVLITVVEKTEPIIGAQVIFSGGTFSVKNGLTDSKGQLTTTFYAPQVTKITTMSFTAIVTKLGYNQIVRSSTITVIPFTVTDWPSYHGGATRQGYSPDGGPTKGTQIWSYTAGAEIRSSPSLVGNKVYFGSLDKYVYCLNASNAALIWKYNAGGVIYASPVVSDGKLFSGTYDAYPAINKVFALDAKTGTLSWSKSLLAGDDLIASPVVGNGKVFFATRNKVIAYTTTGILVWELSIGSSPGGSPSYDNGVVYVPRGSSLVAIKESNGQTIWASYSGMGIVGAPVIFDNTIIASSADGKMASLNKLTGQQNWKIQFSNNKISVTPAFVNNRIYVGSIDGKFASIYANNGTLEWKYQVPSGNGFMRSPVITDTHVYTAVPPDKIYAFHRNNGTVAWTQSMQGLYVPEYLYLSSALSGGRLFIQSDKSISCYQDAQPLPYLLAHVKIQEKAASGETVPVTINVTSTEGLNIGISGVSFTLSTTGGILGVSSGTTNSKGEYATTLKLPEFSQETYVYVSIAANKVGYTSGTGSGGVLVTPAPDFAFNPSPSPETRIVVAGEVAIYSIDLEARNGLKSGVTLKVSGVPSGCTVSFTPNPITPTGTSYLNVATKGTTPKGTYTLIITGTMGTRSHSVTVWMVVNPPASLDFAFNPLPSPSTQTITQGSGATYTISITAIGGFSDIVGLSASGVPTDAAANIIPSSIAPGGTSKMTVYTSRITPLGEYTITISAMGGGKAHTATVTMVVVPEAAKTVPVHFDVYNFETMVRILGAKVTDETGNSAKTDSNGMATLYYLPGSYKTVITADKYRTKDVTITVSSVGFTQPCPMELLKPYAGLDASPYSGAVPLMTTFTASLFNNNGGSPIRDYTWVVNGVTKISTASTYQQTFVEVGIFTGKVGITTMDGAIYWSNEITVYATELGGPVGAMQLDVHLHDIGSMLQVKNNRAIGYYNAGIGKVETSMTLENLQLSSGVANFIGSLLPIEVWYEVCYKDYNANQDIAYSGYLIPTDGEITVTLNLQQQIGSIPTLTTIEYRAITLKAIIADIVNIILSLAFDKLSERLGIESGTLTQLFFTFVTESYRALINNGFSESNIYSRINDAGNLIWDTISNTLFNPEFWIDAGVSVAIDAIKDALGGIILDLTAQLTILTISFASANTISNIATFLKRDTAQKSGKPSIERDVEDSFNDVSAALTHAFLDGKSAAILWVNNSNYEYVYIGEYALPIVTNNIKLSSQVECINSMKSVSIVISSNYYQLIKTYSNTATIEMLLASLNVRGNITGTLTNTSTGFQFRGSAPMDKNEKPYNLSYSIVNGTTYIAYKVSGVGKYDESNCEYTIDMPTLNAIKNTSLEIRLGKRMHLNNASSLLMVNSDGNLNYIQPDYIHITYSDGSIIEIRPHIVVMPLSVIALAMIFVFTRKIRRKEDPPMLSS
ncbi:MAG: PQQ-binding-like beta-propeller repeat protein [Methanobacteriota archaeon]